MRRPKYHWNIFRGELIKSHLSLKNPDGSPVDLSGATLTVRPPGGKLSASISDPLQGKILVEVSSSTVGTFPYEISIRWPDGQEWILLHGYVFVEEGSYAE